MDEKDKKVLDRLMADKGRQFRIVVDNDSIWVDSKVEEEDEPFHRFNEFGVGFIVGLLEYLGLDVEEC